MKPQLGSSRARQLGLLACIVLVQLTPACAREAVVGNDREFWAALSDPSVTVVALAANVRLRQATAPSVVIGRSVDITTARGLPAWAVLDVDGVVGKITLVGPVTLRFTALVVVNIYANTVNLFEVSRQQQGAGAPTPIFGCS